MRTYAVSTSYRAEFSRCTAWLNAPTISFQVRSLYSVHYTTVLYEMNISRVRLLSAYSTQFLQRTITHSVCQAYAFTVPTYNEFYELFITSQLVAVISSAFVIQITRATTDHYLHISKQGALNPFRVTSGDPDMIACYIAYIIQDCCHETFNLRP